MPWLQLLATVLTAGERAIRGYQFVADAWRQADSALQPYVAEAHQALERQLWNQWGDDRESGRPFLRTESDSLRASGPSFWLRPEVQECARTIAGLQHPHHHSPIDRYRI